MWLSGTKYSIDALSEIDPCHKHVQCHGKNVLSASLNKLVF